MNSPKGYREVEVLGFRGFMREPWPSPVSVKELLGEIGQPCGQIVKMRRDRAIKVRSGLHVKEEFLRGWRSLPLLFKGLLNRGRLRRQWRASLIAQERGIPTPMPLAYLEEKGRLPSRSLLVTVNESDFTTLSHYLRKETKEGNWIALRGYEFLRELASEVRGMHEKGMIHHDLKGSNILVKEEGEGWAFLFTDLKAARFMNLTGCRESARTTGRESDIIRLLAALRSFFSQEERRHFLCSYLPSAEGGRDRFVSKWEAESLKQFPS